MPAAAQLEQKLWRRQCQPGTTAHSDPSTARTNWWVACGGVSGTSGSWQRVICQPGRPANSTPFPLMRDGAWRTPEQMEAVLGARWSSIIARLRDLRKGRLGGYTVD